MTGPKLQLANLDDPRLAAHALSPMPVWLWSAGADRILWANPVAAAVFAAASPAEVTALRFDARHAYAVQIGRLAGTLAEGEAPRLERLRGFGASIGGTLICLCSRIVLADGNSAILLVSTERAGKELALPDRARRLLHDLQRPSAIFTADGELIEAQAVARERTGAGRGLLQLGAEDIAREATAKGAAEGRIEAGHISIIKLGAGPTFALLVAFVDPSPDSRVKRVEQETAAPSSTVALEASPRRIPFRFVWETDAETRFRLVDQEFTSLIGPKAAAVAGSNWNEVARAIGLDPDAQIANALRARETFSGIHILWPIDGSDQRLTVEMSGLPVFDRERRFKGFRGFGICRNIDKINEVRDIRSRQKSVPLAANAPAPKVLTFPAPSPPPVAGPTLNAREHSAFQELARELSQRLKRPQIKTDQTAPKEAVVEPVAPPPQPTRPASKPGRDALENRTILDRLPVGILVYRLNSLIYANRVFLDWTGYATLDELAEAGGLDSLFIESKDEPSSKGNRNGTKSLTIAAVNGKQKPVEGRLFSVTWNGENALALVVETRIGADTETVSAPTGGLKENRELKAILDTATDGVLVLDRAGRVLSANRSAQALFGYEADEFAELSMTDLLVPESHRSVLDHLDQLSNRDGAGALHAGYEAIGRVRQGGFVPLHITIGRIEDGEKLCAVLRDVTAWKRTEEELVNAKQAAEKASMAKSEFLAKISHEIRTPLNAIIGFSEVMMDERFGPIGSDRYRQYLKDIHASGDHLISLLNDLLDLSKIEAGRLELTFVSVNLNDLVQQCVAIMQQQANRERVIVRTSLPENLPQVIADARSVRQIALNLLSNSIKFTGAGGQIIISTTQTDAQEVVLRVRDTGTGMSEIELQAALEPFRQVATATRWGSSGTGLGLPITKALAEANHARFRISSQVDDGTLVEVVFPASRVLAQ